jgi:hypothetical protein
MALTSSGWSGLLYDLSVAQVEVGFIILTGGDPEAAATYYQGALNHAARMLQRAQNHPC